MIFFISVNGQSSDVCIKLNSGFFFFSGASSVKSGMINYNLDKEDGYTNNPYGKNSELAYGLSLDLVRVTKSKFIFGVDLGYEILKSRININSIWLHGDNNTESINADGKTTINHNFVNIFPYFGRRFVYSNFDIDLNLGLDFGYLTKATEKGSAKSDLREFSTSRDRKYIDFDIRPRLQIMFSKNKYGGYVGYSRGFVNYKSGFVGGTNLVFSNLFRFGLSYKL
jgi:hypothetical protein